MYTKKKLALFFSEQQNRKHEIENKKKKNELFEALTLENC